MFLTRGCVVISSHLEWKETYLIHRRIWFICSTRNRIAISNSVVSWEGVLWVQIREQFEKWKPSKGPCCRWGNSKPPPQCSTVACSLLPLMTLELGWCTPKSLAVCPWLGSGPPRGSERVAFCPSLHTREKSSCLRHSDQKNTWSFCRDFIGLSRLENKMISTVRYYIYQVLHAWSQRAKGHITGQLQAEVWALPTPLKVYGKAEANNLVSQHPADHNLGCLQTHSLWKICRAAFSEFRS